MPLVPLKLAAVDSDIIFLGSYCFLIILKLTFIQLLWSEQDSLSVSFPLLPLSEVDSVLLRKHFEVRGLNYFL